MAHTAVTDPPSGPPPPSRTAMTPGDKVRFVLRGIGQTLITLGLVVLLFVVYEVWITNIFAAREQSKVAKALKNEWANSAGDPLLPLPGETNPTIPLGTGIGVLYIPRLGLDFHFTIVEGSVVPTDGELEKGPAHYHHTALPGAVGNFAVAGHRVGKGEPFLNIDKLRAGDSVIVETKSWWYVYKVKGNPAGSNPQNSTDPDGIPGREIVNPSDGRVLLPVPDHINQKPTERLMTMTTCHPKFTASHRMIVYSVLVTKVANPNLQMPASIRDLYKAVKA
jgi:sortase A